MESVYENMTPLIPNTTMQKVLVDGVLRGYTIAPNGGYVLHDKAGGYEDPMTGEYHATFSISDCSCGANYDFTPVQASYVDRNGNTVSITAYGAERMFYAVPEDDVNKEE